jgi:hypothetical protein
MSEKIQVVLDEVKEVFLFLEQLNSFFHDPEKYGNQARLIDYVENGMYDKLNHAYYETVWNWLPSKVQKQIEDRPSPFEKIKRVKRPDGETMK